MEWIAEWANFIKKDLKKNSLVSQSTTIAKQLYNTFNFVTLEEYKRFQIWVYQGGQWQKQKINETKRIYLASNDSFVFKKKEKRKW